MKIKSSVKNFITQKNTSNNLVLIAGPCSVESEEQILRTARELSRHRVNILRGGIWKPRTRPGTFQGYGVKSLKWLKAAGEEVNLPTTVEVATPRHVDDCLKHGIDVLWIGARTTTNPFSVQAIADALKGVDIPVMVKNPINPDIELWIGAFERLTHTGIKQLMAIHRGFSSYRKTAYRNIPNWQIPIELRRRNKNIPLICDPSHICGNVNMLKKVSQEAMDLLYDGLMVEVHFNPKEALSDAKQQIIPSEYGSLIENLRIKHPDIENKEYHQHVLFLRKEIDDIDKNIITSLSKRMTLSNEIGKFKKMGDISTFQPNRWNEILRNRVKFAEKNNLDKDFILRLYQLIHEESIRRQGIELG